MELILEEKDADDWLYRGEGAANLVLGYSGSSSAFVGKVIRVPKASLKKSEAVTSATILTTHEQLLWKDMPELVICSSKEMISHFFALHVMCPLLGYTHTDAGRLVRVSKEFLEEVEKRIIGLRPVWRVDAAKVNTFCDYALLMSDHSLFSHGLLSESHCIAVEVKPKCGFLPFSSFIAEANAIKKKVSRFKMHQALKFHQGEISELSLYDPLGLFSGSRERMSHAIESLFTTPQNNFRVFLDGLLIYGGLGGYSEATCSLMDACERGKEFVGMLDGVIKASNDMRLSSFIELVTEAFHHSGVLNKLLEVQKLDLFDIEGAIHAYYDIISQPCNICKNLHDEEMIQRCSFFHSLPLEESLKIVREYLISVTAKDCSVMISFQPRRDGEMDDIYDSIYLTSTSQSFNYKVHFIDLDMKPLKKMVYHYELDQKITSCYRMHMVKAGAGNCECVQNAKPRTGVIDIKHEQSNKV
ncbi:inositol-pentakisphosphate 2-kinase-like isoform X1 [Nymphaea colorata]|uniref:inositol-pentakisphosphate 2-kinase-like isoform X1 n=1 Tax=Nymphaea colorata TaxID=210225 RepID=UPI00129D73A3|nr:inositol-pentakisphosphate 2-kinase-like isoform X1 [Nymphaea colorata]XP_031477880.1 inositol-pentakisphosphate 2-kinase-like isoform X1 [Nymphaea colorata]